MFVFAVWKSRLRGSLGCHVTLEVNTLQMLPLITGFPLDPNAVSACARLFRYTFSYMMFAYTSASYLANF